MGRKAIEKREQVERVIRFPTPLYLALREKAEQEDRSIQGQVIAELRRNIEVPESKEAA